MQFPRHHQSASGFTRCRLVHAGRVGPDLAARETAKPVATLRPVIELPAAVRLSATRTRRRRRPRSSIDRCVVGRDGRRRHRSRSRESPGGGVSRSVWVNGHAPSSVIGSARGGLLECRHIGELASSLCEKRVVVREANEKGMTPFRGLALLGDGPQPGGVERRVEEAWILLVASKEIGDEVHPLR